MSVFTKIFIVINLALTLGLTGVAGSLFAQRANHHYSNYRLAHQEWVKAAGDLKAEQDRGAARLSGLKAQTDEEEQAASAAVTRNNELLGRRTENDKNVAAKSSAIATLQTQLQRGAKGLNDVNDDVKSLTGQRNQAEVTKNDAVAFRNRASNNLRETQDDVASATLAIANIKGAQLQRTGDIKFYEDLLSQATRKGVPVVKISADYIKNLTRIKLNGEVTKVDLGVYLLFIDVGKGDGVMEGMKFTVSRGDKYVCMVEVKTLNEDDASAWILVETMVAGSQPRVGDRIKNFD